MKTQILSDLHREYFSNNENFPYIASEADLILIAGDVCTSPYDYVGFLKNMRCKTSAPIVAVLGNHEFYKNDIRYSYKEYLAATQLIKDFYLLENSYLDIGNVRILGATLWSDFCEKENLGKIIEEMPDFKEIDCEDKDPYFLLSRLIFKHKKSVQYLRSILQKSNNYKTIVLTHFCPSFSCIPQEHKRNPLKSFFASDLEELIRHESPDFWVCGHMHNHCNFFIGSTNVLSNPFGYEEEYNSIKYIEGMMIEL